MTAFEVDLFDEYKGVDAICRDMYAGQEGVKQYLADMERQAPRGAASVPSWKRDYQQLRRVKSLRNQIAHQSAATDCDEEDVAWLQAFRARLLQGQDPLALLRKSRMEQNAPRQASTAQKSPLSGIPLPQDGSAWQKTERPLPGRQSPPTQNRSPLSREGGALPGKVAAVLFGLLVVALFLFFYWNMVG